MLRPNSGSLSQSLPWGTKTRHPDWYRAHIDTLFNGLRGFLAQNHFKAWRGGGRVEYVPCMAPEHHWGEVLKILSTTRCPGSSLALQGQSIHHAQTFALTNWPSWLSISGKAPEHHLGVPENSSVSPVRALCCHSSCHPTSRGNEYQPYLGRNNTVHLP